MKTKELLPRYRELLKMKTIYSCIPNPYLDEYMEITQRLINIYSEYMDLNDLTDEENE